ncbi:MAG: NAD(P)/FAD-dependent oxidoreductase [Roseibium sp.]|uniref:FAD/NAD(P)-dependent oxidoreductase n=1 Tax=Roseibium sp. TaxID=1936156 RepID=UPI002620C5E6|nr:NAD(P)/FAD-dependent oxidoreductase [Roseibium sp.]MCV0427445.1 NAD(P)/FAD-dependent oxidoreductase [Roseibium sp.]
MSRDIYDIAIIGAGPAGMAAAIEADRRGASVVLLDEQPRPGGQIYRNVGIATPRQREVLGQDYAKGDALVTALERSGAKHLSDITVWQITGTGRIAYSRKNQAEQLEARQVIVATGATERPVPLPGWTLPGVLTAGAAQILMKSGGLVAEDAVLVGSGPLLYLIAAQMVAAGSPPKAMIETQTGSDLQAAMKHLGGALRGWRYLAKGLSLIAQLKRAGVRRYTGAGDIKVLGSDRAEAVSFTWKGRELRIETDTVLLHQGVVPNTQITRSLQLDHRYEEDQRCFVPVTDTFGLSSSPIVSVAGDGAGIGGAAVAALSGQLAALGALHRLDLITNETFETSSAPILETRAKELAVRPFLDRAYPPSQQTLKPVDTTIICRCEEVTAGDIRRYAALGCKGPNQAKAFGRSGMGPCQGRYCGLTVTEILSAENGISQQETGALRIRSPIKPVTLGELAAYQEEEHA